MSDYQLDVLPEHSAPEKAQKGGAPYCRQIVDMQTMQVIDERGG